MGLQSNWGFRRGLSLHNIPLLTSLSSPRPLHPDPPLLPLALAPLPLPPPLQTLHGCVLRGGSVPCSSPPITFGGVHSFAAAWVQDPPSPSFTSLSAPHPQSFLGSSFLQPLSFSQTPCLPPAAASSAPRPPATLGQLPFPGVPEHPALQVTTLQGHCCFGLCHSHQAGRSRRRRDGEHPAASSEPGIEQTLNKYGSMTNARFPTCNLVALVRV